MKSIWLAVVLIVLAAGATLLLAQSAPNGPLKEHEWLQQFVGEWESTSEMVAGPDQPPQQGTSTESVRAIGGYWIVAETHGNFMDTQVTGIMTLGYDTLKRQYIGTWIDSTNSYCWLYTGQLDATENILTLETEGPNPFQPGNTARYRDVVEFTDADHRILTSSALDGSGNWVTFLTAKYQRKK